MSDMSFYTVSKAVKKQVGLQEFAIEKDWWVVQTLRTIFSMEVGSHLLFKGGTSLSKAWGLIDRFSEDVDLSLDRAYLGFSSGLISKTQVGKLRSKSFQYITEEFAKKLEAAFNAGCKRFDGAIKGFGGCPMAKDDLVGNMPTELMLAYFDTIKQNLNLNLPAFKNAEILAQSVFPI